MQNCKKKSYDTVEHFLTRHALKIHSIEKRLKGQFCFRLPAQTAAFYSMLLQHGARPTREKEVVVVMSRLLKQENFIKTPVDCSPTHPNFFYSYLFG